MWKRNRNGATVCAPHPYFDSGTRTRASRPRSAASDSINGKKKYGDGVTVDRSAPRESGGKLEVTNCDVQSGRQDGPAPAAVWLHRTRRHRSGSQEPVRDSASSGTGRRMENAGLRRPLLRICPSCLLLGRAPVLPQGGFSQESRRGVFGISGFEGMDETE